MILPQKRTAKECKKLNITGKNDFETEYMLQQKFFRGKGVHKDVKATIILGDLSLQDSCLPPKVLLVKLSGMHSNLRLLADEKRGMAQMTYKAH